MIQFKTRVKPNFFGRNRLVIESSHYVVGNKFTNMLRGPFQPMLDVDEALRLRELLDEFIARENSAI